MNVPPKILKSHMESHLPARSLQGVYINRSATGQEPLPVLQAFQSFLEIERQRTRNRILASFSLCCWSAEEWSRRSGWSLPGRYGPTWRGFSGT